MKTRQKILIVGFGDVAERLARLFDARHQVFALVRKPERAVLARQLGLIPLGGDLSDLPSLQRLAGLAQTVFHLAPPPGRGHQDSHTRNLIAALSHRADSGRAGMLPQRLVYISTTGVYGDCLGDRIDETRPLNPQTDRAQRRVDAETVLRAWGRRSGVAIAILRAPGIYAADRLPIERLHNGTPALASDEDVFTNHIHADDLARIAWRAANCVRPNRIYNAVDNSDMRMGEYFDLVADHFGLPRPPRISRAEAGSKIGPAMLSFMNESRRISNARLRAELGVDLRYASVGDFLQQLGSG